MESNFFSGSENLYKYLVTIGLLMVTLSIYYPLDNKEKLELEKIELYHSALELNKKVKENSERIKNLEQKKTLNSDDVSEFIEIKDLSIENEKNQAETEKKNEIVKSKERYITYYTVIFWIFSPLGIILIIFGFIKWKLSRKIEDEKCKLEKEKLELEVQKLNRELDDSNKNDS